MNNCPTDDVLLRLGEALGWEVEGPLAHLHDCAACAATLRDLREIDRAVRRTEVPDPEQIARILAGIEAERTAEAAVAAPSPRPGTDSGFRLLTAALVAFVVVITAAALQSQPVRLGPALGLAVLCGAIAAWIGSWERERRASPHGASL